MKISPNLLLNSPLTRGIEANLKDSYEQFLTELREDVSDGETSELLSQDFQDEFAKLIKRKELDSYGPKKYYWLNLIDTLVETVGVLEEDDIGPEMVIDFFENTEYLGFILKELEDQIDPREAIGEVLQIQELQIISFFMLHISQGKWEPNGPVAYRQVPELGEGHGLFLGDENNYFPLPDHFHNQILPIAGFNPKKNELLIDEEDEILVVTSHEKLTQANLNHQPELIRTEIDDVIYAQQNDRIKVAQNKISQLSSDLSDTLCRFTSFIVPIKTEEIVSYSMPVLPHYSCINLYNRDDVDLIDDLIHENGHHFLNALLEGEEELILEDDDKIFFSPWRRALRPIRGLYHGFMTFYWAYRLFKEISSNEEVFNSFDETQRTKIQMRLCEEEAMLLACTEPLEQAFELGKVTPHGKNLTLLAIQELNDDTSFTKSVFESLSSENQNKISTLRDELENKSALKSR